MDSVTLAANGLEVTRSPLGSRPTAITLIERFPNGGPYEKVAEMLFTFPIGWPGLPTDRMETILS
jgi:hypothetical protein